MQWEDTNTPHPPPPPRPPLQGCTGNKWWRPSVTDGLWKQTWAQRHHALMNIYLSSNGMCVCTCVCVHMRSHGSWEILHRDRFQQNGLPLGKVPPHPRIYSWAFFSLSGLEVVFVFLFIDVALFFVFLFTFPCVCVCVCLTVTERAWKRERERGSKIGPMFAFVPIFLFS